MRVFILGFFATLQVRPRMFFTLSAEVPATQQSCNCLQLFTCCPAAGDSDTEGAAGGTAAVFKCAFVAVSDVEKLMDGQKLGGGGYLQAGTHIR